MLHEETVRVVRRFALAFLTLLFCQALSAQGTVTIYGRITDPSGAAIAGAKVTVTNQSTEQSATRSPPSMATTSCLICPSAYII